MSKIGKKIIEVPAGVEVKIENHLITAQGPKGRAQHFLPSGFSAELEGRSLKIAAPTGKSEKIKALWGTTRALVSNAILGVNSGFSKQLEIEGIGFRAQLQGKSLVFSLGFSHPVNFQIPDGINISVDKNIINISGISKELVGQVAANIRALKKPEPYKGKGIHYVGEVIRRKSGKKVAGTTG